MDGTERDLTALRAEAKGCHACRLRTGVVQPVVSQGAATAPLLVIGEAPGPADDLTGLPFSGPSGELLWRILGAVGLGPLDAYLTNAVKCRPPAPRSVGVTERETCTDLWLAREAALLRPRVVLALGNTALQATLGLTGITAHRGGWHRYAPPGAGWVAPLMPMFHPAYLLRVDSREPGSPKWLTWQDIQEVRRVLDGGEPGYRGGALL